MESLKNPSLMAGFSGGLLVGVVVTSAAKTMAVLALPLALAIGAGAWYWKKRKSA